MKIGDLFEVRTGLVLSRKQAEFGKEKAKYLQLNLKCVETDGEVDVNLLDTFYSSEWLDDNYLTRSDDIIVKLTAPYNAFVIRKDMVNWVITSHFCLIRPSPDTIISSSFLAWYLNSSIVQKKIIPEKKGSAFASLRTSFYTELEVHQMSLTDQEKMAQLYETSRREIELLEQLKEEKERYYEGILEQHYMKVTGGQRT